jgi:hypothetical protein
MELQRNKIDKNSARVLCATVALRLVRAGARQRRASNPHETVVPPSQNI